MSVDATLVIDHMYVQLNPTFFATQEIPSSDDRYTPVVVAAQAIGPSEKN